MTDRYRLGIIGSCRALLAFVMLGSCAFTAVARADNTGELGIFPVGYTTLELVLQGSVGERRPIRVDLWYPAAKKSYDRADPAIYRSSLWGVKLVPGTWDAMTFQIESKVARDNPEIDEGGPAFPVIIYSHGSPGDPIATADILERIASHGFVVIAPYHTGDTNDDSRTDNFNAQMKEKILPCLDGLPSPCLDRAVVTLRNRVLDVTAIIDNLAGFFGDRMDMTRVGLAGWSRGMMDAIGVAAGSRYLAIPKEPRIRAVMGVAAGGTNIYKYDIEEITIPTLLVAGTQDHLTPVSVSQAVDARIGSADKALVIVENAVHRSSAPTTCDTLQAAGAIYMSNPTAFFERGTVVSLVSPSIAGNAFDYCPFESFVSPVDIRPIVKQVSGADVTPNNVPGLLPAEDMTRIWTELAVTFFSTTLDDNGQDGVHFTRYLAPKWLLAHDSDITSAESVVFDADICPPGLDADCLAQDDTTGVLLRSATELIDDTSTGRLMEGVVAAFAQFDNDVRSDRTRAGMRAALELGRWTFPAPLGYSNAPKCSGETLVPDPDRAHLVRRVFGNLATGRYTKQEVIARTTARAAQQEGLGAVVTELWAEDAKPDLRREGREPGLRRFGAR